MKQFAKTLLLTLLCAAVISGSALALGSITPAESDYEFLAPSGLLLQEDGSLLVADGGNNTVVSLKDGSSQVVAGYTLPIAPDGRPAGGFRDGSAAYALFDSPFAIVKWNGNVVVSDRGNHCLRLLANNTVKTLAGTGKAGLKNGAASSAQFHTPMGLAVDDAGTLYIADSGNGCIRVLTSDGKVTTYCSGLGEPAGLCWANGALYATDAATHQILRIAGGKATVVAGSSVREGDAYIGGFADGPAATAEFTTPFAICVSGETLYVADSGNSAIRKITNGIVSTIAAYDGSNNDLWPGTPTGLAIKGNTLYVADAFAGCVLKVDTSKQLFTDVSVSNPFANEISYVYTSGMMNGIGNGKFSSNSRTTRGQIVTILYRMAGQPENSGASEFRDVPDTMFCADAVAWAAANKIVTGYGDNTFRPGNPVTREQMAAFLYRYAMYKGNKTSVQKNRLSTFTDGAQVSGYASEAMNWAVNVGILQGNGGRLTPRNPITRGQIAAMLTRYDQKGIS